MADKPDEIKKLEEELERLIEEKLRLKKELEKAVKPPAAPPTAPPTAAPPAPAAPKTEAQEEIEETLKGLLPPWVDVVTTVKGSLITVKLIPKEEYRDYFEVFEPLVFETAMPPKPDRTLPRKEYEKARRAYRTAIKDIVNIVTSKFESEYVRPPVVLSLESLTIRMGRPRAIALFAYMCQKGSPYHCNYLYNYFSTLIGRILQTWDETERRFLADYMRHAGFKVLPDILTKYPAELLSDVEREHISAILKSTLKKVLSKYAPIYETKKPEELPDSAIKKTWEVIRETLKTPEENWFPSEMDETPFETLKSKLEEL